MKILVTGANGFVGRSVCRRLAALEHDVLALVRQSVPPDLLSFSEHSTHITCRAETDFGKILSMKPHLEGVQGIVHCAARVHQVRETLANPLAEYRRINTQATLALAQAASQAGVKRFIFLSSVKVNGNFSPVNSPFRADQANPQDPYGQSKWEAETGLRQIAQQTGLEVVILRPPLVYGPGVKANFLTMMRWLQQGIPLPLGAINNRRSLVALPNLVSLIELALTHPAAADQTFMVSDQEDLSTTQLLRSLGQALGHPARLLKLPPQLLSGSLRLLGRSALADRLIGDLAVDAQPVTQLLDWKPPISVQQGLQITADDFLQRYLTAD